MNKNRAFTVFLLTFMFVCAAVMVLYSLRASPGPAAAQIRYVTTTGIPLVTIANESIPSGAPPVFPLDLNKADAEALSQLPGIGEVLAGRIVAYRTEHGRFTHVEQLLEVNGIGDKLYAGLLPYITLAGQTAPATETPPASAARASGPAKTTATAPPAVTMATAPATTPAATTPVTTLTTSATTVTTATVPSETRPPVVFPLNLNKADADELMALPGIGETLADRIVAYRRDNGVFHSVEELLNVKGIGQSKLDDIYDDVYVEAKYTLPETAATTAETTEPDEPDPVDLNSAAKSDLLTLPGINGDAADSILTLRESIGGFSSVEELLYVLSKGVYNQIKDYVYI